MTDPSAPKPRRGLGRPFALVTGGKGGVGKSTVAANLAALLARAEVDPLLVDLDFGLANLDVLLGVSPERRLDAGLLRAGSPEDLGACALELPNGGTLLPAGAGQEDTPALLGEVERQHLLEGLRAMAPDHGLVLGDSAAGVGPDVLEYAACADRVLLVTTPEPAALTDAYALLKALDRYAAERELELATPDLFVNFVPTADEARRAVTGLVRASQRFLSRTPRLAGWMPRGRAVQQAAAARRPFVATAPDCPATRQLARLALRWVEGLVELPRTASRTSRRALENSSQAVPEGGR